uniref:Uncharacterized protein n=1 Tax=Pristionchus pacificus TaxID=54126 RepID=A0A8R1US59_PRIPA
MTCSKCRKDYGAANFLMMKGQGQGTCNISSVFKATMQEDNANCDKPVLKFEYVWFFDRCSTFTGSLMTNVVIVNVPMFEGLMETHI